MICLSPSLYLDNACHDTTNFSVHIHLLVHPLLLELLFYFILLSHRHLLELMNLLVLVEVVVVELHVVVESLVVVEFARHFLLYS